MGKGVHGLWLDSVAKRYSPNGASPLELRLDWSAFGYVFSYGEEPNMKNIREEVEVINSIYEDIAELTTSTYTVDVRMPDTAIRIRLSFPSQYPDKAPSVTKVSGALHEDLAVQKFQAIIDSTFDPGEVYLFTFIDEAKAEAALLDEESALADEKKKKALSSQARVVKGSRFINDWAKSDEIRDRSSVFVGRAIRVCSQLDMEQKVEDLLSDKKLSVANINAIAWRIQLNLEGTELAQDFKNDGEAGAGTIMLHVMEMTDVRNVVVVVSRFFDGTHIGSDRFRHIKNCTREALVNGGFIKKNGCMKIH